MPTKGRFKDWRQADVYAEGVGERMSALGIIKQAFSGEPILLVALHQLHSEFFP